jgi:hypothetical protein
MNYHIRKRQQIQIANRTAAKPQTYPAQHHCCDSKPQMHRPQTNLDASMTLHNAVDTVHRLGGSFLYHNTSEEVE